MVLFEYWRWGAVILLVMGIYFIYDSTNKLKKDRALDERGIASEATPVAHDISRGRRRSTTYYLTIRYIVNDQFRREKLDVGSTLYEESQAPGIKYQVKYLPEDPSIVRIEGHPLGSEAGVQFGIGSVVIGAIGVAAAIYLHLTQKPTPEADNSAVVN